LHNPTAFLKQSAKQAPCLLFEKIFGFSSSAASADTLHNHHPKEYLMNCLMPCDLRMQLHFFLLEYASSASSKHTTKISLNRQGIS
jgi:hypothetical protein